MTQNGPRIISITTVFKYNGKVFSTYFRMNKESTMQMSNIQILPKLRLYMVVYCIVEHNLIAVGIYCAVLSRVTDFIQLYLHTKWEMVPS